MAWRAGWRFEIERLGVELDVSVGNAQRAWNTRESVIVRVTAPDGASARGEACPLPGYSPDDTDQVERELVTFAARARASLGTAELSTPGAVFEMLDASFDGRAPAARFALETALLGVLAAQRGRQLHRLFSDRDAESIPLSALIPAEPLAATPGHVQAALDRGFRSLKIKLGRTARFAEERELLSAMKPSLAGRARLRFDANGAFALSHAHEHLSALAEFEPEFVEEPVTAGSILALSGAAVPLALDESLTLPQATELVERAAERRLCQVLILKPTLLGGFAACQRWARLAERLGLDVVVTHCFEGPIAHSAACELAFVLECRRACGLASHAVLAAFPDTKLAQLEDAWLRPRAGIAGLKCK
jgi:o-succinylbenzoate synthase